MNRRQFFGKAVLGLTGALCGSLYASKALTCELDGKEHPPVEAPQGSYSTIKGVATTNLDYVEDDAGASYYTDEANKDRYDVKDIDTQTMIAIGVTKKDVDLVTAKRGNYLIFTRDKLEYTYIYNSGDRGIKV